MVVFSRYSRVKILIISSLAFILLTTVASASELDVKQQQLKNIQAQVEANKNQQNDIEKQQADLLKQIQENDRQVAQLQVGLNNLQDELKNITANRQATEEKLGDLQKGLDKANAELNDGQKKLAKNRKVFNKRLISTYKSSSPQLIAVLVNSESLDDFIMRTLFIGKVAENDAKLVSGIKHLVDANKKNISQITKQKKSIDDQRLNLISEENRITTVENQIADNQKQYQDETNKQKQLLAQAEQEKIQLEQAEDMLVASAQMITDQIKKLESGQASQQNFGLGDGDPSLITSDMLGKSPATSGIHFIYPVSGPITSPFGMRFHPVLGVYRMHTGVDFGVATGTPVHASESGTVIIAGPMGGYGNVVVIDHGGGFSSLYAHNSSLAVSVGEHVSQGQVISYSGATGLATGPHLHFEIRVNGTPEDPMKWL